MRDKTLKELFVFVHVNGGDIAELPNCALGFYTLGFAEAALEEQPYKLAKLVKIKRLVPDEEEAIAKHTNTPEDAPAINKGLTEWEVAAVAATVKAPTKQTAHRAYGVGRNDGLEEAAGVVVNMAVRSEVTGNPAVAQHLLSCADSIRARKDSSSPSQSPQDSSGYLTTHFGPIPRALAVKINTLMAYVKDLSSCDHNGYAHMDQATCSSCGSRLFNGEWVKPTRLIHLEKVYEAAGK